MKKIVMFVLVVFLIACKGQNKSDYEAYWEASPDASDYFVFWEELLDTTDSQLVDSLDWMVAGLTVTVTVSTLAYTEEAINDGKYIRVGIVARNSFGIYGLMRVSGFLKKGTMPIMVGSVGIRKK